MGTERIPRKSVFLKFGAEAGWQSKGGGSRRAARISEVAAGFGLISNTRVKLPRSPLHNPLDGPTNGEHEGNQEGPTSRAGKRRWNPRQETISAEGSALRAREQQQLRPESHERGDFEGNAPPAKRVKA